MMKDVADKVFRAYDIRGLVDGEITVDFAFQLGLAFVKYVRPKKVFVCTDTRSSKAKLYKSLKKGICAAGSNVYFGGVMSTPQAYYEITQGDFDAGIIITASHNPEGYNGFKLMKGDGTPISGKKGGLAIKKIFKEKDFTYSDESGKEIEYVSNKYGEFLTKEFSSIKKFNAVVDKSNGSGRIETQFFKEKFEDAIIINEGEDGFNHEPDPTSRESQKQLKNKIREEKKDFGIIFDGDADRVVFLDETGTEVRPDIIACIIMENLPKGKIVQDTRSTNYLKEKAESLGLENMMSKSGRTNMIETLKNEQGEFGVEGSGHYFFKKFNYLDCPMLTIKYVVEILQKESKTLSDLRKENTKYYHSGEHNFKVKRPDAKLSLIRNEFSDAKKILFLDGVSIYEDDYWFNVRKSNTQPLLRINLEAKTKDKMKSMLKMLEDLMTN